MGTKVLILAAGPSVQWKGPNSRHLLPIAGEPLVMRTQRICSELGYPATIVTDVPEVQEVAQRYFDPGPNKWIYDTIRNTQELWTEHTVLLCGDVLFDEEIIWEFLRYGRTRLWTGAYGVLALAFAIDVPRGEVLRWLDIAWNEANQRGHGELQILIQLDLMRSVTHHISRANIFDFDIIGSYQKCVSDCPWVATEADAMSYLAEEKEEAKDYEELQYEGNREASQEVLEGNPNGGHLVGLPLQ